MGLCRIPLGVMEEFHRVAGSRSRILGYVFVKKKRGELCERVKTLGFIKWVVIGRVGLRMGFEL